MPANAGIQNILKILDPGVRRDDGKNELWTFYGAVKDELRGKCLSIRRKNAPSPG